MGTLFDGSCSKATEKPTRILDSVNAKRNGVVDVIGEVPSEYVRTAFDNSRVGVVCHEEGHVLDAGFSDA